MPFRPLLLTRKGRAPTTRTYLIGTTLTLAAVLFVGGVPCARATDLVGLYVGAAAGQSTVRTGNLESSDLTPLVRAVSVGEFSAHHSAYKAMLGVRPISLVGAEIAYIDFGHPSKTLGPIPGLDFAAADVRLNGATAVGVLYLPISVVDVYAKAGFARLQATSNVTVKPHGVFCLVSNPPCLFTRHDEATNTSFAGGAGVQLKFGSWALRGEYERFNAAGGNPALVTLGIIWTFI